MYVPTSFHVLPISSSRSLSWRICSNPLSHFPLSRARCVHVTRNVRSFRSRPDHALDMPGPTAPSAQTLLLSQETLKFSVCFPMGVRGFPALTIRDRLSESRMAGVKFHEVSVPSGPHPRRVSKPLAPTRPGSKVVAWVYAHSHAPSSGPLTHPGWAGHVIP